MLAEAVQSYLAVRRATGFDLKLQGNLLKSFTRFSDAKGNHYVCSETAIEWAGSARSILQRARRLGAVIRFARYIRMEDQRHQVPPAVFGCEKHFRPVPYLELRRPYASFDDHVFVSLKRRPILLNDAEVAFRTVVEEIGLPRGPGLPRPTLHSLRHTFAVRALETCPDGRDRITKHMLALSTYLGHSNVAFTYWYLEATPDLMKNIAEACQSFATGGRP